jgi:hypothetical protein
VDNSAISAMTLRVASEATSGALMNDKIRAYLRERALQNATNRTWGIGTLIGRAAVSPILSLQSVNTIEDQFVISKNCDAILPIISETLRVMSNEIKDPSVFDFPTASFCVILYYLILGRIGKPNLIFVTARPLSDASTNILLNGYCLGPASMLKGYVKKVHDALVQSTV